MREDSNTDKDISNFRSPDNELDDPNFEIDISNLIESSPWKADLLTENITNLDKKNRVEKIIANYTAIIYRNLPDIDQTLIRNLLADIIFTLQPSLIRASDEIAQRYKQTGEFQGYDHPDLKNIIEKHMQSSYYDRHISRVNIFKLLGTPLHEFFGEQKYAEGESAIVAKNVHTIITRIGNSIACLLFIEGMFSVLSGGAIITGLLLYTAIQILNEYTNEVEHSTNDKKLRNFKNRLTKWATILTAKSIPLLLTALGVSAITTPRLHQEYLIGEAAKLEQQMTNQAEKLEKLALKSSDEQLKEKRKERDEAQKILDENKDQSVRDHANTKMYGGKKNGRQVISIKTEISDLEEKRRQLLKPVEKISEQYSQLGEVGFLLKNYKYFFGEDLTLSKKYYQGITHYNDLPPGVRFENGMKHIAIAVSERNFSDEILMRVWIAFLFESLSIITLVVVQSRADYRRVVTNSDTQSSLGQIVESSVELQRQLSTVVNCSSFEGDANHIVDEDKKINLYQSPTYSSLVNSFVFHQIMKDMFCRGQIPSFNQIVLDISKGLIHPTPCIETQQNSRYDRVNILEQEQLPVAKSDRQNYSNEDNNLATHQDLESTHDDSNSFKNSEPEITEEKSPSREGSDRLNENNVDSSNGGVQGVSEGEVSTEREAQTGLVEKSKISDSNGSIEDITVDNQNKESLPIVESKDSNLERSTIVVYNPSNIVKQRKTSSQENEQIIRTEHENLINIPGYIIKEIESEILSNEKGSPLLDLAVKLSAILSKYAQEKDEDNLAMINKLKESGKDKDYSNFINEVKDLNSDVQDIIDTYGASQDRLDLKNAFKDKLRSICKQYYEKESYKNASILNIKDMVNKIENQERNISLNILRISLLQDFIVKRIEQNTITPCLLSHIVCQLRCGDLISLNISRRDRKILEKLKKFQLSSPYEEPIELLLFKFDLIANKYSQIRTGFFNTGWFGRNKLKPFQDELREAIEEYIQTRKNSSSKSIVSEPFHKNGRDSSSLYEKELQRDC